MTSHIVTILFFLFPPFHMGKRKKETRGQAKTSKGNSRLIRETNIRTLQIKKITQDLSHYPFSLVVTL